jgi:hypothetical protein
MILVNQVTQNGNSGAVVVSGAEQDLAELFNDAKGNESVSTDSDTITIITDNQSVCMDDKDDNLVRTTGSFEIV